MSIRQNIFILSILLIAAFVRLYRISTFTQFRGDQGSAGIIIYEALQKRELPLVGPIVSTGQYPGPAYYYLIALPLILSNFNPVVPAIMFALFGVATVWLLYYLTKRIVGKEIGLLVATLYAVSPPIVAMDRTMWNPTAIPFLITVMLVSLYKVHEDEAPRAYARGIFSPRFVGSKIPPKRKRLRFIHDLTVTVFAKGDKKPAFLLLAAFCLGIAVQLHYINLLWIPVLMVWWACKSRNIRWALGATSAFVLPLMPFLYFEARHQFIDIRQLLSVFLFPAPRGEPGLGFIGRFRYVVERTFFPTFPLFTPVPTVIAGLVLLVTSLWNRKKFWPFAFSTYAIGSIFLLSWYKGPFFDHYLWFFLPVPFLLIGFFISMVIPKSRHSLVSIILILVIFLVYIPKLELTKPRIGDIERTKKMVDAMFTDSGQKPFSFGLISSLSYSDIHYRFFFLLRKIEPLPVLDPSHKLLYLVCEGEQCPPYPYKTIESMKQISVYCYDDICKSKYPVINLTTFIFDRAEKVAGATLYIYHRT